VVEALRGFIGLGSNLGDRLAHLQYAVDEMAGTAGLSVQRLSSVYECPPWGYVSDRLYLNAVAEVLWAGAPVDLLRQLYRTEAADGRHKRGSSPGSPPVGAMHYADRTLDLDILWLDGVASSDAQLVLPHPLAHCRAFVLLPWAELAPSLELDGHPLPWWIERLPREEALACRRLGPLLKAAGAGGNQSPATSRPSRNGS